ncbi:MAG: ATP synthase F1 subunit epsilon [Chitinophagales bacterium]|jgi:F-type H+-transporting ATPase subunit epsilon|nr:ATP synthase F1 subunit epsilon [Bacteroidota bacterium]MBP9879134.1 ATP synthase F1 subunit epsilon [Chitinophagales bacterium]MBK9506103.1 ATP synthase F1 subunit epsilon [Bacteroidota bacterium]MBK9555408.1 ATP synthase F1 subunit epsilon [Bacteroidota bacterium]MBL0279732.1 ATP synthase F1 subunit epsilon [Bacteroidota bacterium]
MQLEILSPDKKIYSGEAVGVQMPGVTGSFEVLNNHAPMIAALATGKMRVNTGKENVVYNIKGGFVEILNNNVSVLVEGVELA